MTGVPPIADHFRGDERRPHTIPNRALGNAGALRPGRSDFDFLRDLEGVVDLYTK
jgi:hypothetical protein